MSNGYVYIISDQTRPYLLIGCTTRIPEQRVKELDITGVPGQLELVDSILVDNCEMVEAEIHRLLAKHRYNPESKLFDIPKDAAVAYLRTFSRYSEAEHFQTQERADIDQAIANISLQSLASLLVKLGELVGGLSKKYTEEFPHAVSAAGSILYESFCSSPGIFAEHSNTPVAISINDDNIDAWSIGIGEYRFVFDGRTADPKLVERFDAEGPRVLRLSKEIGRLNALIGSKGMGIEASALHAYQERALEIISSTSDSPLFSHNELARYAVGDIDIGGHRQMGGLRDSLTDTLHQEERPSLTDEEIKELDALKKTFNNMTDLEALKQILQLKNSNPEVARQLRSYSTLWSKDFVHNDAISRMNCYQDQLVAIDKIDAIVSEVLKPFLTALCEVFDLVKEAQETYLSFIECLDLLIENARKMLFHASSEN